MLVLNDGSWSGFLSDDHFVRLMMQAILESWVRLAPPDPETLEDSINRRLCAALVNDPTQRKLPFHVVSQWEDIEDDGGLRGVPDIRIMPKCWRGDDEEFLVMECKRLRYQKDGKHKTANAAYIDGIGQGMTAFVDGRYPAPRGRAAMAGFVLSRPSGALRSLETAIKKKRGRLGMAASDTLAPTQWSTSVHETVHSSKGQKIRLYHVLLDISQCAG